MSKETLVHHHLIVHSKISREINEESEQYLREFMLGLLAVIEMELLIAPVFKFSDHLAWTGLMGIVTSHITFHLWTKQPFLQLDIYSCKAFDQEKAIKYISTFFGCSEMKSLFIERAAEEDFKLYQ